MSFYKFTKEEVREKLIELGYKDVPDGYLTRFWQELHEMIEEECSDTSTEDVIERTRQVNSEQHLNVRKHIVPGRTSRRYPKPITRKTAVCDRRYLQENEENDPWSANTSSSTIQSGSFADGQSCIKRKVIRKHDGEKRIFDESFTESESTMSDITALEQRLRDMPLKDNNEQQDCWETDITASRKRGSTSVMSDDTYGSRLQYPAFIRPSTSSSDSGRTRKSDPVSRYHQFKEEWKFFKVPGEDNRSSLRWAVREAMMPVEEVQTNFEQDVISQDGHFYVSFRHLLRYAGHILRMDESCLCVRHFWHWSVSDPLSLPDGSLLTDCGGLLTSMLHLFAHNRARWRAVMESTTVNDTMQL